MNKPGSFKRDFELSPFIKMIGGAAFVAFWLWKFIALSASHLMPAIMRAM